MDCDIAWGGMVDAVLQFLQRDWGWGTRGRVVVGIWSGTGEEGRIVLPGQIRLHKAPLETYSQDEHGTVYGLWIRPAVLKIWGKQSLPATKTTVSLISPPVLHVPTPWNMRWKALTHGFITHHLRNNFGKEWPRGNHNMAPFYTALRHTEGTDCIYRPGSK